jgi:hypothetical protein
VRGARFNVNNHSRFNLNRVGAQFHLASALQYEIHLCATSVIVLHRIRDARYVQVTPRRVGARERPRALTARTRYGRRLR